MRYEQSEYERLSAELDAALEEDPAEQPMTKQELVQKLAPKIEAMRKRGKTLEKVAQLLTAKDFPISTGTLRSYLRRKRRGRRRAPQMPGGAKTRQGQPTHPAAVATAGPSKEQPTAPTKTPGVPAPETRTPAAASVPRSNGASPAPRRSGGFLPGGDSDDI